MKAPLREPSRELGGGGGLRGAVQEPTVVGVLGDPEGGIAARPKRMPAASPASSLKPDVLGRRKRWSRGSSGGNMTDRASGLLRRPRRVIDLCPDGEVSPRPIPKWPALVSAMSRPSCAPGLKPFCVLEPSLALSDALHIKEVLDALSRGNKNPCFAGGLEPSDGLEPSTPSLPWSDEAGQAGTGGSRRPTKSLSSEELAEDE